MQFIEAVQKEYSVGVPGLYTMLADAHNKFGVLKWEKLFISAIQHSEGFQIGERLNKLLNWAPHIKKNNFVNDTYFTKGEAKKKGSIIQNLELKKSLKILSIGRLTKQKNFKFLVEVFSEFLKSLSNGFFIFFLF